MSVMRSRGTERDRGATLIEMAMVAPLIFAAIFAVVEFGLAFKDYLTVSSGAREGARAASTYGNDARADILVLRDVQASLTLGSAGGDGITTVNIRNPRTGASTLYTYKPGTGCWGGDCCDWQPCPDSDYPPGIYTVPNWNPASRDISAPFTDAIEVEVSVIHSWLTNFFLDTSVFTVSATHQIEPQVFE